MVGPFGKLTFSQASWCNVSLGCPWFQLQSATDSQRTQLSDLLVECLLEAMPNQPVFNTQYFNQNISSFLKRKNQKNSQLKHKEKVQHCKGKDNIFTLNLENCQSSI